MTCSGMRRMRMLSSSQRWWWLCWTGTDCSLFFFFFISGRFFFLSFFLLSCNYCEGYASYTRYDSVRFGVHEQNSPHVSHFTEKYSCSIRSFELGRNCQNNRVIGSVGTPLLDHFTIARTALYIYMQKKAHYPSLTRPDALGSNLSPPV